jgi:hypothetical protein
MKKTPDSISRGVGSDVPTRSTGGGVEQRLLRLVRRRRATRLHVVANVSLTLAAKRAQAEARTAATPGSKSAPADLRVAAKPSSPRLHVVVCKGAAGVFASKPQSST